MDTHLSDRQAYRESLEAELTRLRAEYPGVRPSWVSADIGRNMALIARLEKESK